MNPVRRAANLFFARQLRIRWQGGPRLEFLEQGCDAALSADDAVSRAQRDQALMLKELSEVLDDMPDIRDAVRHLAFVDQSLRQHGLQALYAVPLDVLQQALEQFEGLVSNWSPRGLASLRSKMAVAVLERESRGEPSILPPPMETPTPPAPAAAARFSAGRR